MSAVLIKRRIRQNSSSIHLRGLDIFNLELHFKKPVRSETVSWLALSADTSSRRGGMDDWGPSPIRVAEVSRLGPSEERTPTAAALRSVQFVIS
jgi:hypothetical protein